VFNRSIRRRGIQRVFHEAVLDTGIVKPAQQLLHRTDIVAGLKEVGSVQTTMIYTHVLAGACRARWTVYRVAYTTADVI
jgi:hypothetical protein